MAQSLGRHLRRVASGKKSPSSQRSKFGVWLKTEDPLVFIRSPFPIHNKMTKDWYKKITLASSLVTPKNEDNLQWIRLRTV